VLEAYTTGAGPHLSAHFAVNQIVFLNRNLDQNMFKIALIFRKKM